MGSASHRLQRCLCVTETKDEEPLAFRINVKELHMVGTESPVIADLPVGADARRQRNSERLRWADSRPIGFAQGTAGIGRIPGNGRYGVSPHLRPKEASTEAPTESGDVWRVDLCRA